MLYVRAPNEACPSFSRLAATFLAHGRRFGPDSLEIAKRGALLYSTVTPILQAAYARRCLTVRVIRRSLCRCRSLTHLVFADLPRMHRHHHHTRLGWWWLRKRWSEARLPHAAGGGPLPFFRDGALATKASPFLSCPPCFFFIRASSDCDGAAAVVTPPPTPCIAPL